MSVILMISNEDYLNITERKASLRMQASSGEHKSPGKSLAPSYRGPDSLQSTMRPFQKFLITAKYAKCPLSAQRNLNEH